MSKTKSTIIAAVAYLRKSTMGKKQDGKERQEKSIDQQLTEVQKLKPDASDAYNVMRNYADPGRSGWKRGAARPDFARLLADCQKYKDAQAILVDDLDRFSRATVDEVWTDINALRQAGVKYIHSANQGIYCIGDVSDIGTIIKITVGAWSANDYSRKLSRRISLARRNKAKEGKRSGGYAPYGFENDGDTIKPGNPEHVKIVKRIFKEFVNHATLCGITKRLNEDGIPAPRGGKWHVGTIKEMLQQPAYLGDFEFGRRRGGKFFTVDDAGEVVEAGEQTRGTRNEFHAATHTEKKKYKPIIDAETWARAQAKLKQICGPRGSKRPRENGYVLTGVLHCGHCGKALYGGARYNGTVNVYRCPTHGSTPGVCKNYEIREDRILPYVLGILVEEIDKLALPQLTPMAPDFPTVDDQRESAEKKLAAIKAKIYTAAENVMFVTDARTRDMIDGKIKTMWLDHDALKAELAAPQPTSNSVTDLVEWWEQQRKIFVPMPLPAPAKPGDLFDLRAYVDAYGGDHGLHADPLAVRAALTDMGCEIRLRWREEPATNRHGKRFVLTAGRLRLGQKTREIPMPVLSGLAHWTSSVSSMPCAAKPARNA